MVFKVDDKNSTPAQNPDKVEDKKKDDTTATASNDVEEVSTSKVVTNDDDDKAPTTAANNNDDNNDDDKAPADKKDPLLVQCTSANYQPSIKRSEEAAEFYTMAHIVAPKEPEETTDDKKPEAKKEIHLTAVMDVSGSMSGGKLNNAKEALKFIVEELSPNDRFGVVEFNSSVREVLPLTAFKEASAKMRAKASIDSMRASGTTNLSGGLFQGIEQVRGVASAPHNPFADPFDGLHPYQQQQQQQQPFFPHHHHHHHQPRRGGFGNHHNHQRGGFGSQFGFQPPAQQPQVSEAHVSHSYIDANGSHHYTLTFLVPSDCTSVSVTSEKHNINTTWTPASPPVMLAALPATVPCVSLTFKGPFCASEEGVTIPEYILGNTNGTGKYPLAELAKAVAPTQKAVAEEEKSNSVTRVVLLFTDGDANCGITDSKQLNAQTRAAIDAMPEKDVTVFTFGFGADHNATLLRSLAEITQGTYYFVQEAKQMPEIFADCLGGLQSIVAQNIRLKLRPLPGVTIGEVMTKFPVKPCPDEPGAMVISMKDLYSEEERDIVVRLVVNACKIDNEERNRPDAPLVVWEMSCVNTLKGGDEQHVTVDCSAALSESAFEGAADTKVDEQIARHRVTEAMDEARQHADRGDIARAQQCIKQAKQRTSAQVSHNTAYGQALYHDLEEAEQYSASTSMWAAEGQKRVNRMEACHGMQRANYSVQPQMQPQMAMPMDDAFGMPQPQQQQQQQPMYSNARKENLRNKAAKR